MRLAGGNLRRSDTESLIAGISPSEQYKTSTQSQYDFEATNMSQMTLARRAAPRLKALQDAHFDPNQSRSNLNSNSRTSLYMGAIGDSTHSAMSDNGYDSYRDTGFPNSGDVKPPKMGTMLSNIGASIFQRVPDYNEIQVSKDVLNVRKTTLPSDYKRSNIRFG